MTLQAIEEMYQEAITDPATSFWAPPIVMVKKKRHFMYYGKLSEVILNNSIHYHE